MPSCCLDGVRRLFEKDPRLPARALAEAASPISRGVRATVCELLTKGELFHIEKADAAAPVVECERQLASFTGFKHCVAAESFSASLFLALKAAGVGNGAKVLGNAVPGAAARRAVRLAGGQFVPVENGRDFGIDPLDLAAKADQTGARLLVLSHICGCLPELDEVALVCSDRGLRIVEDCADSLGALWNGRHVGHHGLVCCFSAQAHTIIGAARVNGGFALTDDDRVAALMAELAGRRGPRRPIDFGGLEDYSLRLPNVAAAALRPNVLSIALRVREANRKHARVSKRFLRGLRGSSGLAERVHVPVVPHRGSPCYGGFQFLAELGPQLSTYVVAAATARGVPLQCVAAAADDAAPAAPRLAMVELQAGRGNGVLPHPNGAARSVLQQAYRVAIPASVSGRTCDRIADVLAKVLHEVSALPSQQLDGLKLFCPQDAIPEDRSLHFFDVPPPDLLPDPHSAEAGRPGAPISPPSRPGTPSGSASFSPGLGTPGPEGPAVAASLTQKYVKALNALPNAQSGSPTAAAALGLGTGTSSGSRAYASSDPGAKVELQPRVRYAKVLNQVARNEAPPSRHLSGPPIGGSGPAAVPAGPPMSSAGSLAAEQLQMPPGSGMPPLMGSVRGVRPQAFPPPPWPGAGSWPGVPGGGSSGAFQPGPARFEPPPPVSLPGGGTVGPMQGAPPVWDSEQTAPPPSDAGVVHGQAHIMLAPGPGPHPAPNGQMPHGPPFGPPFGLRPPLFQPPWLPHGPAAGPAQGRPGPAVAAPRPQLPNEAALQRGASFPQQGPAPDTRAASFSESGWQQQQQQLGPGGLPTAASFPSVNVHAGPPQGVSVGPLPSARGPGPIAPPLAAAVGEGPGGADPPARRTSTAKPKRERMPKKVAFNGRHPGDEDSEEDSEAGDLPPWGSRPQGNTFKLWG